jgi:hypothetical protein
VIEDIPSPLAQLDWKWRSSECHTDG